MTQEGFNNLTVLNSHIERTAKFASPLPPPHLKVGGHRPPHFKTALQALLEKESAIANQTPLRDRPLKSNGGGGGRRSTKKHARKRKLNEKNPCTPINP